MPRYSVIPRIIVRGTRLACTLAGLSVSALMKRNGTTASERALWLQRASTRILRILGVELDAVGSGYSRGLVVANHVGYLDVLVLGALWPTAFVAKSEVRDWPVFGRLTRAAGTLFIRRRVASDLARVAPAVGNLLKSGVPVVVFPEGTSTDGSGVLPFRPALFSAAVDTRSHVTPVWIGYRTESHDAAVPVAYWGEMTLLPHLVGVLGLERIVARVRTAPPLPASDCRKALANAAHGEVIRLSETTV